MTAVRMPRRRRGTAASLVALVGLLACAAGATFAIVAAVTHRPWLIDAGEVSRWARDTTLGDVVALVVGIVAAALGLVLLLAAVLPARRGVVELAGDDDRVAAGVDRGGLVRSLRAAAESVDGIGSARVAGRRTLTVRATTSLRRTEGLTERVQQAVEDRLTRLGPAQDHRVRVKLARKER